MIKAVIFDLDDTLYPEWSYIKQGFLAVSGKLCEDFNLNTKYSSNDIYKVLKNIFFNNTRIRIFNYLPEFLPEIRIDEKYIVNEIVPTYRFSEKTLKCYPDVKPTLDKLYGNIKIGMVSNGNVDVQNNKIDLLKIRKYFDEIEISGNYPPKNAKPSTYMLNKILGVFELEAQEILYVGDNPLRDICAIKAGCNFFRIKRDGGLYVNNDWANKVLTINDITETLKVVNGIHK